jgi:hypothetical protein
MQLDINYVVGKALQNECGRRTKKRGNKFFTVVIFTALLEHVSECEVYSNVHGFEMTDAGLLGHEGRSEHQTPSAVARVNTHSVAAQ